MLAAGAHISLLPLFSPFLLDFYGHASYFAALMDPLSLQCLQPMHCKGSKGNKVCVVLTHQLRSRDKGYLHWGKVVAVEGSECTIKWHADKKPSSQLRGLVIDHGVPQVITSPLVIAQVTSVSYVHVETFPVDVQGFKALQCSWLGLHLCS